MAARFRHDFYEDEFLYLDYLEREPEGLIIERGNLFEDLGDYKFFERFRLTKETVYNLEFQVRHRLQFPTARNQPISAMNRLLTALRFYVTGSFTTVIGDTMKMHRTTAGRIIHEVSNVIASLSNTYIKRSKLCPLDNHNL